MWTLLATVAAWIPCPGGCGAFLCTIHYLVHAHDCPCPPIEEWETNPYEPNKERNR